MTTARSWNRLVFVFYTSIIIYFAFTASDAGAHVPRGTKSPPYKALLQQEARKVWGPNAPIAMLAAQIEAESSWNPRALSPSGDEGLAQIHPSTARYLQRIRPGPGKGSPRDPKWALSAQSWFLFHQRNAIHGAANECEHWALTLAAYVGGLGWVVKERQICSRHKDCDPGRWFNHTEKYRARGKHAFRESRRYLKKILQLQNNYLTWGPGICGTRNPERT